MKHDQSNLFRRALSKPHIRPIIHRTSEPQTRATKKCCQHRTSLSLTPPPSPPFLLSFQNTNTASTDGRSNSPTSYEKSPAITIQKSCRFDWDESLPLGLRILERMLVKFSPSGFSGSPSKQNGLYRVGI